MPAPTNQTPATAIAMSLDYTATLADVDLATPAPVCEVWYSYTAAADDTAIGFFAGEFTTATYEPATTVWTGPVGSLVQVLSISAVNRPLQAPVTPGETYYFRVRNTTGLSPAASTSLSVSAVRGPRFTAPVGSILINDDSAGFPAVLVSGTDGSVLQFQNDIPAGEDGDTLDDGTLLIYDFDNNNMKVFEVTAGALVEAATVALSVEAIRTNLETQNFWVATQTNPATLRVVASDGSIGATIWTLTHNSVFALATNLDESIAYYSQRTSGSAIHTFNLGTSTPGANLAAGIGAAFVRDILYLSDDTLLASSIVIATGDTTVRRYSTAGAVLNTYGPYTSDIPGGTQPRLAYGETGTFWLWIHGTGADEGLSFFHQIDIATGVDLAIVEATEYEGGVYNRTPTATPSARFGNSFSCPFIVTRVAIDGPESPTPTPTPEEGGYTLATLIPRRLRRTPHLSKEQLTTFFHYLQIDLQAGVGTVSGQGVDPQVMLRMSRDGGRTWGNEMWVGAGEIGDYTKRAMFRRLGKARDCVFEVVVSDPVPWMLCAAYLDAELGQS
jgi:hypothetical protein